MTAVIQFVVLKRRDKWALKSKDLERTFSRQREAVDAAIRFANDSGKGRKSSRCSVPEIENQIRKDLDIRRKTLSTG